MTREWGLLQQQLQQAGHMDSVADAEVAVFRAWGLEAKSVAEEVVPI
jgi:hypothetical protein